MNQIDIIATIGPASWQEDVLTELLPSIAFLRFPFAKETPEGHNKRAKLAREIMSRLGLSIKLMADLPGGKPRLGNDAPMEVSNDQDYSVSFVGPDTSTDFFVLPGLSGSVLTPGSSVSIGDGENTFVVTTVNDGIAHGRFSVSGLLERKRAFIPTESSARIPSFTDLDKELARHAQAGGFDSIALSFVNSADDVREAREWLKQELNWEPYLIAKIETTGAVQNAEEIARVSDAVMVARGDLAVQGGFHNLWRLQQETLRACQAAGTYAIVATGFLESLHTNPLPSRSEAIDIACAVDMGAQALMLSSETTIGPRPLEAVAAMRRLITQ